MGQPYIGEIRMFGGSFAPAGWATCDGQFLPISENDTLFNLIGTTYGGDGQSTFGLPNLSGRAPIHQGTNSGNTYTLGQPGGAASVTLSTAQIPSHTHPILALGAAGDVTSPTGAILAGSSEGQYATTGTSSTLNTNAAVSQGGALAHDNQQPLLAVTYIISLFGIFPPQTGGNSSDSFLGELRIFSDGYAPAGWAQCNGQLLAINQNQALFALFATTFGGDGRTTFGLPDLRGRVAIHSGNGHTLGSKGGEATHTLISSELPAHIHTLNANTAAGNTTTPVGNYLAASASSPYSIAPPTVQVGSSTATGGGQAHENMSPYLPLNICIALQGIFPSQN